MRTRRHPELVAANHPNAEFLAGARPSAAKPPKKSRPSAAKRYAASVREAQIAIDEVAAGTLDFEQTTHRAVVGLFILLHTKVYGVEPDELRDGREMDGAQSSARRLVESDFRGRVDYALDFVRWTWAREKKQFATRASDWRIGWRWQLTSRSAITDYRIAMAKTRPL
jgi:hypothetical protein